MPLETARSSISRLATNTKVGQRDKSSCPRMHPRRAARMTENHLRPETVSNLLARPSTVEFVKSVDAPYKNDMAGAATIYCEGMQDGFKEHVRTADKAAHQVACTRRYQAALKWLGDLVESEASDNKPPAYKDATAPTRFFEDLALGDVIHAYSAADIAQNPKAALNALLKLAYDDRDLPPQDKANLSNTVMRLVNSDSGLGQSLKPEVILARFRRVLEFIKREPSEIVEGQCDGAHALVGDLGDYSKSILVEQRSDSAVEATEGFSDLVEDLKTRWDDTEALAKEIKDSYGIPGREGPLTRAVTNAAELLFTGAPIDSDSAIEIHVNPKRIIDHILTVQLFNTEEAREAARALIRLGDFLDIGDGCYPPRK